MAQKINLVDDLDGTLIESGKGGTVEFSVAGASYEIDLTKENEKKLLEAVEPFVAKARRTSRHQTSARASRSARTTSGSGDLAAIRAWAQENGYKVASRGRVSADIIAAYTAAH